MGRVKITRIMAFDTETTGVEIYGDGEDKVFGISACNLKLEHDFRTLDKVPRSWFEALTDPQVTKIFHNMVFDLQALKRTGIKVVPPLHDTMAMASLLDPHGFRGLAECSYKHLGDLCISERKWTVWRNHMVRKLQMAVKYCQDTEGWESQTIKRLKVDTALEYAPPGVLREYARMDAVRTMKLFFLWYPALKRLGMVETYMTELDIVPVIMAMTERGIHTSRRITKAFIDEFTELFDTYVEELGFNPHSAPQVGKAVYGEGHKGGGTDRDALLELAVTGGKNAKMAEKVVKARRCKKAISTYLMKFWEAPGGVVRSDWLHLHTPTGRFRSRNPNMQNLPGKASQRDWRTKESPILQSVRDAVRPRPGYRQFHYDYKQVELRVMAHYCEERRFIEAISQGRDFFTEGAVKVFDDKSKREAVKLVVYGFAYGMSDKTLTEFFVSQGETEARAQRFLDMFRREFPRLFLWKAQMIQEARTKGYTTGVFGRRFFSPKGKPHKIIAYVIQGTAAELMKRAMIRFHKQCQRREARGSYVVGTIHDEIILEIPRKKCTRKLLLKFRELMEVDSHLFRVPIVAEIEEEKPSWRQCVKLELGRKRKSAR